MNLIPQCFTSKRQPGSASRLAKQAMHLVVPGLIGLALISQGWTTIVCAQQTQNHPVTLHGRVVDAHSGEPVAKVRIVVSGSSQNTTTDETGAFTLTDVPPGELSLYITTVGYGLVKKTITVKEADTAEVVFALNQEAATLTERVTVTPEPYAVTETNAASEQTLNKTELQDVSKVILSDPIRAVQSLPGVAANDDLHAEFAVRGADYRRVGVFLDGVLVDNFLHFATASAEQVTLSVINTDTINEVSLLSGAFPAKYGDARAAVLDLSTRDGNRLKPAVRISTGLQLGTSGVADGPLANKRGSWLIAARSSLLDYVSRAISRISEDSNDSGNIDFSDVAGKVIYDLSSRSRIGIGGHFSLLKFDDRFAANQVVDPNAIFKSRSRNSVVNAFWDYTPNTRLFVQTRIFGTRTNLTNTNPAASIISDRPQTQFGARSDLNFLVRPTHRIESGVYVRSIRARQISNIFVPPLPGTKVTQEFFDRSATEESYYLQDTYTNQRNGLSLTGGFRIDHSSLTSQTKVSPRMAMALRFRNSWTVRSGFGRYYQFADFEAVFGQFGNRNLGAEHATHYNLSLERTFGDRYRALVEIYDREDRDVIFNLFQPRLQPTPITFNRLLFSNSLNGHARGVEFTFQRRSANRLSGWVTYSFARTQFKESRTGLNFAGDFDQRHTLSAYGSYRFTGTFNVSGQWRYGSGFPIPGFFRSQGADLFLASARNAVRLPAYSRIDLRANKAFLFEKWKLTLSAELLNVTARKNLRVPIIDGFDSITGQVFHHYNSSMPVLPALGVAIEF